MDIKDALQIVLDAAKDQRDLLTGRSEPVDADMLGRLYIAIDIVEDMTVNQFGDD